MSATLASAPTRPPRRALRKLIVMEGRLAWREPVGLVLGVGVPVLLLVIFGLSSGFEKRIVSTSPTTLRTAYVPILISLVLVLIALISLPLPIVVQRETAFLRRLSTTPIPPRWLLAAQVVLNLALAVLAMIVIVAGDALFFGVHAPSQVAGFVLSALLAALALFSIGLLVAAVAPSQAAAGAIGSFLIFPLMFFAGLWTPSQTIRSGSVMHQISNLTPLGAAVHAMLNSMQGTFPTIGSLEVMAAWAAIFGVAAVKLFRWE
jgi:ABC-2 type transport system permease protein